MPPHTTTAKITNRLQNEYYPESQKIELYRPLTTKVLKKPHLSRQVGGTGMWTYGDTWRGGEAQRGAETWNVPYPHVVDKNWEGYLGSEGTQPQTRPPSPGF